MRGGETGEGHDGVDKVERPLGDRVGVDAVGRLNVEDGKVAGAKAADVAHKVVGLGAGVVAGVAKVVGAADGDAAGLDALPVLVEVRVKVARALGRLAELATKQNRVERRWREWRRRRGRTAKLAPAQGRGVISYGEKDNGTGEGGAPELATAPQSTSPYHAQTPPPKCERKPPNRGKTGDQTW